MRRHTEESVSTEETHPSSPLDRDSPPPRTGLWHGLTRKYDAFRADLISFDEHADGIAVRIDSFLKRHEGKLEFLKPAMLSFVGCVVFACFDAFGRTHILEHFTGEHVAALGHPYFVLGAFLLAAHLLFITPDGKSLFGKWVIGTFSSLVEHVLLLGWGVFLWLSLVEMSMRPTLYVAGISALVSIGLLLFALIFSKGARLCRGGYFHLFTGRPGRLMLMRVTGVVLAVAGGIDLHRYLQHHQDPSPRDTSSRAVPNTSAPTH